jgi:hypothetical protein
METITHISSLCSINTKNYLQLNNWINNKGLNQASRTVWYPELKDI